MSVQHTLNPDRAATILIVDDEPDTCELLALIFHNQGYKIQIARDGMEAICSLRRNPADVVLLDLMMPVLDGWETYQQIRRAWDMPVLFLSALDSGEAAVRALDLGADDYVRKPYHSGELVRRVQTLVKLKPPPSPATQAFPVHTLEPVERPTVSVIIPTLNEEKNLPLVLPYIPLDWVDEVILVDGRSTDHTVAVAKKILPSIRVILECKPGKGAAMQAGYRAANGEIIVLLDADGSNDPREIPRFVQTLIHGADFAKGSRFAPGGGTSDMPRIRQLGNRIFVHMVNLLFNTHFTDLCYGMHAFWRYCLDQINLENINGFEIDTALYIRALNGKLRIVETPSFEGYRFYGEGKLRTIPDGLRVLKTILLEWKQMILGRKPDLYLGFRGKPTHQSVVHHLPHLFVEYARDSSPFVYLQEQERIHSNGRR